LKLCRGSRLATCYSKSTKKDQHDKSIVSERVNRPNPCVMMINEISETAVSIIVGDDAVVRTCRYNNMKHCSCVDWHIYTGCFKKVESNVHHAFRGLRGWKSSNECRSAKYIWMSCEQMCPFITLQK
jgi:hypothetical protein